MTMKTAPILPQPAAHRQQPYWGRTNRLGLARGMLRRHDSSAHIGARRDQETSADELP